VTRERGSTPVELALGVALLLLPTMLLVLVLPTWAERQAMVRVAAQEAARAAVLAGDWGAARLAAAEVAANHGLAPDAVGVTFDGRLHRGGTVAATASARLPVVVLPGLGAVGGFTVRATHREPVDPYRSLP
jgi:hypothetical protein